MTFKEEIELQLRDNRILSYDLLIELKDKNYFSGKNKQIGDTVLFGLLSEGEEGELKHRLITIHEEEIGSLYEEDIFFYKDSKTNKLPNIKKIENGGN